MGAAAENDDVRTEVKEIQVGSHLRVLQLQVRVVCVLNETASAAYEMIVLLAAVQFIYDARLAQRGARNQLRIVQLAESPVDAREAARFRFI